MTPSSFDNSDSIDVAASVPRKVLRRQTGDSVRDSLNSVRKNPVDLERLGDTYFDEGNDKDSTEEQYAAYSQAIRCYEEAIMARLRAFSGKPRSGRPIPSAALAEASRVIARNRELKNSIAYARELIIKLLDDVHPDRQGLVRLQRGYHDSLLQQKNYLRRKLVAEFPKYELNVGSRELADADFLWQHYLEELQGIKQTRGTGWKEVVQASLEYASEREILLYDTDRSLKRDIAYINAQDRTPQLEPTEVTEGDRLRAAEVLSGMHAREYSISIQVAANREVDDLDDEEDDAEFSNIHDRASL